MPKTEILYERAEEWFRLKNWKAFPFQQKAWKAFAQKKSGIVNAPTGSGKTYSLMVPIVEAIMAEQHHKGLFAIWITPIRALAKEIELSANAAIAGMGAEALVGVRTGDTSSKERQAQKKNMPQILITTPESLHILFAQKKNASLFSNLRAVVIDEWHELLGSKRGVQVELALSRLRGMLPNVQVWGISATIGNMEEAMAVLQGKMASTNAVLIRSNIKKKLSIETLMPEEVNNLPWAGHLGIKLIDQVVNIIRKNQSTLIFTNTRAQSEIWYHQILEAYPEFAGVMAMHHSSISRDLRAWVEDALYHGQLKAVVCTSSLDLGVDFRPVDAIVQVGGPKGVSRFVQRAGRSGHQPGAESKIYFLPTNALELVEAAALRQAIKDNYLENRDPYIRSFDVLIQYLTTLAVGDGFNANVIYNEVRDTFCFESITLDEWKWCLRFITTGGDSLKAYDEYQKVEREGDFFTVQKRSVAMRHRMSIGTIVSDKMLLVKYQRGGAIGHVEEYFVSSLNEGDVFWFAGRCLEFIRLKDLVVQVKNSKEDKGKIPSWQGGRLNFSSKMSDMLRLKLEEFSTGQNFDPELQKLAPILELQASRSHLPSRDEFLIEQFQTKEGYHLFMYPFEGRLVHEGIASLLAYRMSLLQPISFSLAYNDYGFELLSDQEIPLEAAIDNDFFSTDHLMADIEASINSAEMAKRKFRDIAVISGMVFTGFPGKYVKDRHLQSSSSLIFDVFADYDAQNLLLRQAFDEVMYHQLEMTRFRAVLKRIQDQKKVVVNTGKPSPLSFPIMVDRLREKISSEKLSDRIAKMTLANE